VSYVNWGDAALSAPIADVSENDRIYAIRKCKAEMNRTRSQSEDASPPRPICDPSWLLKEGAHRKRPGQSKSPAPVQRGI